MSDFHFLRPWWLIAFAPATLLVWRMMIAGDQTRAWQAHVAPHLLKHLIVGRKTRSRWSPLVLLSIAWTLSILALAGPAWQREPTPFADDTSALVILLKVTPSMTNGDLQPTRLGRAVEKIHDLLKLRRGSQTALVAYSGSVHRVMPLTTDAGIIDSFAAALVPGVMPVEGDVAVQALKTCDELITKSGQGGWILWICDSVKWDQLMSLEQGQQPLIAPVNILATVNDGPELETVKSAAKAVHAELIRVTPDEQDVTRLARNTRFSTARDSTGNRWSDAGFWLVPCIALIQLNWFRSGWLVRGAQ